MKLLIQIPCFNEREQLPATLADLPRRAAGVDAIELLVIDDGSTDGTAEIAEQLGVHYVLRFPRRRGLAAAFQAGVDASLRVGADVIVNTDADNQYRGEDIARLVEPILAERADLVIGDRRNGTNGHFSLSKRWLQRLGTWVVRRASGVVVRDATSGFRAMNRKAALTLFVHNRFSYTLETLIQAGQAGLAVENVPVRTNPVTRPSRLFGSTFDYLRKSVPVILRSFLMYWPVQTFGGAALLLLAMGLVLIGRFLYFYLGDPGYSGHVQSLLVGVGAVILSFVVGLMAMLGDLLAANRRLAEETLVRLRRLELAIPHDEADDRAESIDGLYRTGAAPWLGQGEPVGLSHAAAISETAASSIRLPRCPSPCG
ncbi:MAG: glycosyltransferase family 2 protein [Planctomycetes bacterium]|nr:glycosyltransferase family 2 protein [Planctomycetota bacterium]